VAGQAQLTSAQSYNSKTPLKISALFSAPLVVREDITLAPLDFEKERELICNAVLASHRDVPVESYFATSGL
jgi:hypothetical protein